MPNNEPVPYSGKPTEFSKGDTSRPTSSIRQARLRTTPFSHAFQPRFPATPKPRLSATSFSHAFRPCLPTCHSDRGRCVFVTAMFQANEPLSDTFILGLIDDVIDQNEGLITDVHLDIAHRRHGINMSFPKRLKPFHRQRVLLQDANIPSHTTQVI